MKTFKQLTIFGFLVCIAISCKPKAEIKEETKEENSVEATAPDAEVDEEQGYILDGLNHGLAQSPVNIITNNVNDTSEHKVVLHYESSNEHVKNLGHTIQVDYEEGNTLTFDGKVFEFKQFHFHTPSEHLIDGITYPIEMHMVHMLVGQKEGDTPIYLVGGALFKEGSENEFLNEFMDAIPNNEGDENVVEGKVMNINDLFDQADNLEYYNYQGSLTTPPYTETVTWLVLKYIFEASPEQIERFNKLEGNNARHVQALYGRKISEQ